MDAKVPAFFVFYGIFSDLNPLKQLFADMGKVLVEITTEKGEPIYVESELGNSASQLVSADRNMANATKSFEKAMQPAMAMIRGVVEQLKEMPEPKPETVELEFGLKISGGLDIFAVSVSGEGNINMKLSWRFQ